MSSIQRGSSGFPGAAQNHNSGTALFLWDGEGIAAGGRRGNIFQACADRLDRAREAFVPPLANRATVGTPRPGGEALPKQCDLQSFCDQLAEELQANIMIVRQVNGQFSVAAAAPWTPALQALDRVALDWCFRLQRPTGFGSGRSAGSDWLFLPVSVDGKVALALGVTGRLCRRRFRPSQFKDPLARLKSQLRCG